MDFETNHSWEEENRENKDYHSLPVQNPFVFWARGLGIFSLFSAFWGFFPVTMICGSLAIILAVLSKGADNKMEKKAKIGMITGIAALILQLVILVIGVYQIVTLPEYQEYFNNLYEEIYDQPLDPSIELL